MFKNKVIIVYGARQVGKTTLSKEIFNEYLGKKKYLNCEEISIQQGLSVLDSQRINDYLGDHDLIILDEAQKIKDIGMVLKLMIDTYPDKQIIATGSSSFDLANKISEPLTGRTYRFVLYPFSIEEIRQEVDLFGLNAKVEKFLRFGSYPEVYYLGESEAMLRLNDLVSNYLYKDAFSIEWIKKPSLITNLLQLLALQLGNEVSYQELARQLNVSAVTIQRYIDILEQCFVVFRLSAFSRNKRKEIAKSIKIYFYDLGIRNSLIQGYNPLNIRNDIGALWENFCIIERKKFNAVHGKYVNNYFWRTYSQKEIDLIEEHDGKLYGYEFKWGDKIIKPPKDWQKSYPDAEFKVINRENYLEFIG